MKLIEDFCLQSSNMQTSLEAADVSSSDKIPRGMLI